jgi:hypothetical protein
MAVKSFIILAPGVNVTTLFLVTGGAKNKLEWSTKGPLLALATNIRLGWKVRPEGNTGYITNVDTLEKEKVL